MPANLKVQPIKVNFYNIKGDTLKDVWKQILKKGPVDPNDRKHVACLTTTTLSLDPDKGVYELDGKVKVDSKTGWYVANARVRSLEASLASSVDVPRTSGTKFSKAAKAEWKRFMLKAQTHEKEHCDKAVVECRAMISEINALRGTSLAETEREAVTFAVDDLKTQIFDSYRPLALEERLNRIHKGFDKKTKHGAKTGAKLQLDVN